MENKIKVRVDAEDLDIATGKAKQLVSILREVQEVLESLSIADDCAVQIGSVQKTLEKQMELLSKRFEQDSEEIVPLDKICHLNEELRKTAETLFWIANQNIKFSLVHQEGERAEEMECVFHWLDCLYQDFRNKRTAGEQFPCNTCKKVGICDNCPPIKFNLAGEKFGLKVNYTTHKSK